MKILLYCTVTAVLAVSGAAGVGYASGALNHSRYTYTPANCVTPTRGRGLFTRKVMVCTLTKLLPEGLESFEVHIPDIDLRCVAYGPKTTKNVPARFDCDRLSLPAKKCTDGIFGSWSMVAAANHYEVDSPPTCKTRYGKPDYKLTSGSTSQGFPRNP